MRLFKRQLFMKIYSTLSSTLVLVLSLTGFLTGCERADLVSQPSVTNGAGRVAAPSTLISATPISGYNTSQKGAYDVNAFRLVYATRDVDGRSVQASGLLLVPNTKSPASLLSLQHYTIEVEALAPSYYLPGSEAYTTGNRFATQGFIVAAADYLGYGAARTVAHPYEHRSSLASASLDMLRAARQFLAQNKVNWNNRLFLEGYSEGGFATLSLQKKLEEEVPGEFNLVASSLGSGAHDKPAFMKYIINNKTSGNANYNSNYIWTLLTYDRVYKLNRPMSFYFKEPYATQIAQKGKDASISVSLNQTFTETFRQGVNDGTDAAFLNAIEDNDVHDWRPGVPTRFYHGDADQLVFYFNSKNAYDAMKLRKAPSVSLITLRGKDHGNAMTDFLNGTEDFFLELDN